MSKPKCAMLGAMLLAACTQDQVHKFDLAVQAACQDFAPVAAQVAAGSNPSARSQDILTYGQSVCTASGAPLAGVKTDPSTAAWLGAITKTLQDEQAILAAKAAPAQ